MTKPVLDPKKLLGFRLLSDDEIIVTGKISAKAGTKLGGKPGKKPPPSER